MPGGQRLAAIILSAGFSSRMEEFKPLLPLSNSTIVEAAISIFVQAGISDITVVLGHRADDIKPILDRLHVRWAVNEKYKDGMFSSILAGLRALGSKIGAVFLLPVDIPLVQSATVEKIAAAYKNLGAHIFYPTYNKQRGHPPLIPSFLFQDIMSSDGAGGLQALLERHDAEALEIDVPDEGILFDVDTRADYERMRRLYERK